MDTPRTTLVPLNEPQLLRKLCFVNGAWVGAGDGATFPVRNPATGETIATVPAMGTAETRAAIIAAAGAWSPWRTKTANERAALLRRWFALLHEHRDDLALLMTSEQGKPLSEAQGEVTYAAAFVEWFAEEARRIYGETIPSPWPERRLLVIKQPVGVVAAITPWNFPAAMITRKCAPALAAGCPVIIKPAEEAPLTALALALLAERAGFPAGVFNVVTGAPVPIGQELTANPLVRKLSFTGSTEVGKLLMAHCAPTVKKISLELGGNAPFIVFDDADIDAAVVGALDSKYRNTGQTCVCANRILVHNDIFAAFEAKLVASVQNLKVGDGLEEGVQQGPLINREAIEKVESHIADAVTKGARVATGGQRHARGGTFFEPTVLVDVTTEMAISREETFGPVAPLFRFRDEAEAIRLANETDSGLAAYFYSRDIGRVWRVAEALEYGIVGVNEGVISTEVAPFGGVKASGLGREGSHHGIEEFLETKYLCLGGLAD